MGSIDAYGDRSRCREWRLKATFHYSSHLQTWFDQVCDKFVRVCDTLSTSFPLFCRNLVANLLHQSRHFEIDAAGSQHVRWFVRVLDKWNVEENRFEPANEPVEA